MSPDYKHFRLRTIKSIGRMFINELKKEIRLRRQIKAVSSSIFFDAEWYLKNNPDVQAAHMNPAYHYVVYGVRSNRNPSRFFINDEYYRQNKDVKAMKMNPLAHYELYGRKEGRKISRIKETQSDVIAKHHLASEQTDCASLPYSRSRHLTRLQRGFEGAASILFGISHIFKATSRVFIEELRRNEKLSRYIEIVRASEFFDAEWYLKNNPDVLASDLDPAYHYVVHGIKSRRNPSLTFVNDEYYMLNSDVKTARINPLVHYELYGKREGRQISLLEEKVPVFPKKCKERYRRFHQNAAKTRRTAIVASYFGDGIIPKSLLYLLRGLKEVVDNIVLVADCPVIVKEIEKVKGLVTVAKFERHEQYDFGSYKRGLEICRKEGLLDVANVDELVIINDSNYGPIYPFSESFETMNERDCDFWGYTIYNLLGKNISSFFYLFRRKVIDSGMLDEFLAQVSGKLSRNDAIERFEGRLTPYLARAGFKWTTYVPFLGNEAGSPTKRPLTTIGKYHFPLVKKKAINGDSYDDHNKTMALIQQINPTLYKLIEVNPIRSVHHKITYAEHQKSFAEKRENITAKVRNGECVNVVFFVSLASMFPSAPLLREMQNDSRFNAKIYVIPDMRWHDGNEIKRMIQCENELSAKYGEGVLQRIRPDKFGVWPDVLAHADIVVYPSPYELSIFRYNPRYAVGRSFLPISVNYGYYRSLYDRFVMEGQSYAYMWKAFFECEATAEEYRKYSPIHGSNVEVVGYMKMDALACVCPQKHMRKRVLIALHHSIEGGTNKMLSLANFVEYADFFKELPDKYPEIDFVFRPHPFLFKVLSKQDKWGSEKTRKYISTLKAKNNVIWSDGGDYFREFVESDACIQDCGSFLVEYFYTNKPCCYMLKSRKDIKMKFSPLGQDCLRNCYLAYKTQEIDDFVRNVVIKGVDPKGSARAEFAKTIMVNHPHSAAYALKCICGSLHI